MGVVGIDSALVICSLGVIFMATVTLWGNHLVYYGQNTVSERVLMYAV